MENNNNNQLISRNSKSASQLVIENNSIIDLKRNPQTGKVFFTCGSITGYASPKAVQAMQEGKDISEFKFAEVSKDNGTTWVPCLMVVGTGAPSIASMGASLLH